MGRLEIVVLDPLLLVLVQHMVQFVFVQAQLLKFGLCIAQFGAN